MDLGAGERKKENNLQPEDLLSAVTYIYIWKRLGKYWIFPKYEIIQSNPSFKKTEKKYRSFYDKILLV